MIGLTFPYDDNERPPSAGKEEQYGCHGTGNTQVVSHDAVVVRRVAATFGFLRSFATQNDNVLGLIRRKRLPPRRDRDRIVSFACTSRNPQVPDDRLEGGEITLPLKVVRSKSEDMDKFLKRFKRICNREGILKEIKQHAYYEKPCDRRRRKDRERNRNIRRALLRKMKKQQRLVAKSRRY